MRSTIHKIRQHPEHKRKIYLYVCMAVATTLLIFIWIMNLQNRFDKMQRINEASGEPGPLELLKEGFTGALEE